MTAPTFLAACWPSVDMVLIPTIACGGARQQPKPAFRKTRRVPAEAHSPAVRKCHWVCGGSTFWRFPRMCRNIKTLFNCAPPVTDDEVRAASLQFVRKITGFNKPSKANEDSLLAAVEEGAAISIRLARL